MSAAIFAAIVAGLGGVQAEAQIAIKGGVVHTMEGESIPNGVVVIRDGKIAAVGPASSTAIPQGFRVIEAAVVTPGLIDAHSVVGLSGQYNYEHDQDQLEHSSPIQPELRASDAYNARERLVEWVRSFGVTTLHTGHAPGELISGQTMIVRTVGDTVVEALVRDSAMLAATLAEDAQKSGDKSPGTRGKMMAMLRAELIKAREYLEQRERGNEDANVDDEGGDGQEEGREGRRQRGRDLGLETLGAVLRGEMPLLVTAQRSQDIMNALRLAEEFKIRVILDGCADAHLLLAEIKASGAPVILHPSMQRAVEQSENLSFTTAAKLREAGILFAIQGGYEGYVPKTRCVLFEAAIAAANGLSPRDALASITIDAARILGVADRVGSLAVGKDADLALYDGDPLEYTTHCTGVLIRGELVSESPR